MVKRTASDDNVTPGRRIVEVQVIRALRLPEDDLLHTLCRRKGADPAYAQPIHLRSVDATVDLVFTDEIIRLAEECA